MTTAETIAQIEPLFPEKFQVIEPDKIVRGQKLHKGEPYKVVYIDFTDSWVQLDSSTSNLESYIEKTLLRDYYSHAGALQWNYYYTFISDSKLISSFETKRLQVEGSKAYARKLVMSVDDFKDWINVTHLHPNEEDVSADLPSIWIPKLREFRLDCVFLDHVTYLDGVERYVSGDPIVEESGAASHVEPDNVEKISAINELKLPPSFRSHPKVREFIFGTVNLIFGINGAGKTSLLEALELLICGRTKRNPDRYEDAQIAAKFNNVSEAVDFIPADRNNKLYKDRDKAWYNSITPTNVPSRLHERFNQFNFFNADAAALLTFGDTQSKVIEAFEDIALGDQVNWLEQRLLGFRERFEKEYKQYLGRIASLKEQETSQNQLLQSLSAVDTLPSELFSKLVQDLTSLKWKFDEEEKVSETFNASFERRLSNCRILVNAIASRLGGTQISNSTLLIERIEKLKAALAKLVENSKSIVASSGLLEDKRKRLADSLLILTSLEKLAPYFGDSMGPSIYGSDQRIKNLEENIEVLESLGETLDNNNGPRLLTVTKSFIDLSTDIEREILALKATIGDKKESLRVVEGAMQEVQRALGLVRAHGLEFVRIRPQTTKCPLCGQDHAPKLLSTLLSPHPDASLGSGELAKLTSAIQGNESELAELEVKLGELSKIKVMLLIREKDEGILLLPVGETLRSEYQRLSNLGQLRASLEVEIAQKVAFRMRGLSEADYQKHIKDLELRGVQLNDGAILGLLERYTTERKVLDAEIERIQKELVALGASNLRAVELTGLKDENAISAENDKLSLIASDLSKLNSMFEENVSLDFSSLQSTFNELYQLFDNYKELKRKKDENELVLRSSNTLLSETKRLLAESQPLLEKSKQAFDDISTLLTDNSKQAFLQRFIEENGAHIAEVYRRIHNPKEFNSIFFEDGLVMMRKASSGEGVRLTEISSGQRSALALAVFLSLNRKLRKGPDVLLFDDPLALVDDLNVLAFFDYLQEIAIDSKRQIFFATANENIAFLFKKKFEFLTAENKFKEFPLVG